MPSSERKWNIPSVWGTVKRFMHVPLSTAERDELQRHKSEGHYCTNNRSRHKTGSSSSLRTRVNQRRHGTENSDVKEIRKLKAKSAMHEEKIERLEEKVAEQSQLMQETLAKVTSVEQAANQQTAQEAQAIGRLEKKVAKLDRDLQERTAELYGMVDRKDAGNVDRIKVPDAKAPELSQGPQNKIAKPSGVGGKRNSPMQKSTTKPLSSEDTARKRDQKIRDSSAIYRKLRHTMEGKRANKPLPQVPIDKTDGISVAEVAELVAELNAELEQTSCRIEDSFSYRSPTSGRGLANELRDYLGSWLCRDLQRRSREPDMVPNQLVTQIALQTGLVNACSRIIIGWTAPDTGQGVANTSVQSRTCTSANNQEISEKYLTSILRQLINAVGGSLQNDDPLPPLHREEVKSIASKAVALHSIINEEVTQLKLVTYTIQCGTEFDSSRMKDAGGIDGKTGSTPPDTVICTTRMGLQRVAPGKSRQEYDVIMKTEVVLAGALDAQGS